MEASAQQKMMEKESNRGVVDVRKLRIGVIGTGFGKQHIEGFHTMRNAEVVAICNRSGTGLQDLAATYSIAKTFTDYHQLLESDEIDAVTIATPAYLHKAMVLDALGAGKHVLSEKPLALNATDAEEIYRRAERSGVKHMTNFGYRFLPSSVQMHALLAQGRIGTPYHVNIRHLTRDHFDPAKPMGWRHIRAKAGMGALGDLGVHNIDLVRWWLGDFKRVSAVQQTLISERPLRDGSGTGLVDVDDATMALAELDCGAVASIHVSRCSAGNSFMEAEVCGSEGTLRFTRKEIRIASASDGVFQPFAIGPEYRRVDDPYAYFAKAVLEDKRISPSFHDGWMVQRIADAIIRSSENEGAWQGLAS